jgi:hypothetical protein
MNDIYNVWLINFELGQMAGYLKVLKTSLVDYQEKLEIVELPSSQEVLEDDEANDRFNAWFDEMSSIQGDFPRRLYSSFVVSWYSIVEDTLLKLCDDLNLQIDYELKTEKKFSKGIWCARDLLQTCCSFQFDPKQWQELTLINKIRNQVVHNRGTFTHFIEKPEKLSRFVLLKQDDTDCYIDIDKNLYNYLINHELLSFYKTYFIWPTPEYCEYLVTFGHSLFDNVFRGLNLL